MMNRKPLWLAVLAAGLVLLPHASVGQTSPAGSSAMSTQETQNSAPAIPLEHQATKEQVTRLFDAMRVREQAARIDQSVQIRLRQQLREAVGNNNSKLPSEQRAAMAKLLNQYDEKSASVYPIDEMLADLSTIYQRYLTREDVNTATAFYTSAAGQNLLNAEPKIAGEAMAMVRQRAQEKGDALTEEMKKNLVAIKQDPAPSSTQPSKK